MPYDVVVTGYVVEGEKSYKIRAIKAIRNAIPRLGLKEAKDLVEQAPKVAHTTDDINVARQMVQTIISAGGLASLQPSGLPIRILVAAQSERLWDARGYQDGSDEPASRGELLEDFAGGGIVELDACRLSWVDVVVPLPHKEEEMFLQGRVGPDIVEED